jgi:hypothetical protein
MSAAILDIFVEFGKSAPAARKRFLSLSGFPHLSQIASRASV